MADVAVFERLFAMVHKNETKYKREKRLLLMDMVRISRQVFKRRDYLKASQSGV